MIKPRVLYGCGTWAMTEQMKSSIKPWDRAKLKKKYEAK
jgi:hypothetical protein